MEAGMAKTIVEFVQRVGGIRDDDAVTPPTNKKKSVEDLGAWEKVKVKYLVQEDAFYLEFNWRDGISNAHRRVCVAKKTLCFFSFTD